MCRKNSLFQKIITVLLAAVLLTAISVLTAAADPGGEDAPVIGIGDLPAEGDPATPDPGVDSQDGGNDADPYTGDNDSGMGNGDNSYEQPTVYSPDEIREQFVEQYNEYYNAIDDLEGEISQYKPNENLGDLPQVYAGDVIEATAEPLPDVAVSDATLFSGIVMWLCVAVGISIVAGVMVSKRTHRRGV